MMNLLALSLVLTSLAAAGVWSPSPEKQKHGVDVIVKEVHDRTIVVEYDEDGQPITKVSISPEQQQQHAKNMVEDSKENIKQPSSENGRRSETESHAFPKKLICDAFGKCKHRIATATGKAKESVSEATHEATDETKERAHEALGKAKETVSHKAHEVEEHAKESVKDAMGKVKEAKEIGEDIATDVSENVEKAKEEAVEKAKEASDKVKRGIVWRGRQVGHGAVKYVTSPKAMGVVNLLGFATAYGMCMWVTFISSYVLAAAMTRQQFGIVQSKIYPVYFRAMACSIAMAFLGLVLGNRKRMFSSTVKMLQAYNLLASLLMVLLNALYLEPRATKVMFERMKMEKEEGRGREELTGEPSRVSEAQPVADAAASTTTSTVAAARAEEEVVRSRIGKLNDRLKKLNSYSSFLNILTLMALNWHLVYLAHLLHLMITC